MARKIAWWRPEKKPARRLKELAAVINEDSRFEAKIEKGYSNTDRKVGRLRIAGKGRYGNRLIVMMGNTKVLDHNSAETYRSNYEVEEWVAKHVNVRKKCGSDWCRTCNEAYHTT